MVLAGDRLLAGEAAFRERDRAFLEACLGRQGPIVQLAAEPGRGRLDAETLELVGRQRGYAIVIEELDCRPAVVVVRNPLALPDPVLAEDDRRDVILQLDLAPRGESHTEQVG